MRSKQGRRKIRRFAIQVRRSVISALALMSVWPWYAFSQDSHSHATQAQTELTAEQKSQQSALIKIVREATERFKDVSVAEAEGYKLHLRLRDRTRHGSHGTALRELSAGGHGRDRRQPSHRSCSTNQPLTDNLKLDGRGLPGGRAAVGNDKAHPGLRRS